MIDTTGTVVDEEIVLEKGELLLLILFIVVGIISLVTGKWDWLVGRLSIRIGLFDFIKLTFEQSSPFTVDGTDSLK